MQEEIKVTTSGELQPDDIIFECPQCSKSLAIDLRGAGYVVRCPDCHTEIQVPAVEAPASEGDTKPDLGVGASSATPPPLGMDLQSRLQHLERQREADAERFRLISGELALLQAAIDRLTGLVGDA